MSIIEKIFKKNANKGIQQKTLESKITEPQQSQTVSSKMGSAEDHLKIAQDKTHDDRIAYYFSIKDSISLWGSCVKRRNR